MPGAGAADLRALVDAVQTNCHIADAHCAGELSLCVYLLALRELYRWEQGLPFAAELPRAAIASWIAARETLWASLADRAYAALPCAGAEVDPFDVDALNRALHPRGWHYGAGLVGPGRADFVVAERLDARAMRIDGEAIDVIVCGRELARGLLTPPAVLAGGRTVLLRRAALGRWLWERFEAYSLKPHDGPVAALRRHFGLADNAGFDTMLPAMLDELAPTLLLHEVGERRAGRTLDPAWGRLRQALADDRRAELRLRAVRDLLADCGTTLPALLAQGASAPLHFWFAGFEGQRETLFPGLRRAYVAWCGGDGGAALRTAAAAGATHFGSWAAELAALVGRCGDETMLARAARRQLDDFATVGRA